jgi:hypothetical protein
MRPLWLSFLIAGCFGQAAATTIHVPVDQPTIQAGIDAANPGDDVVVACGTYFEHDLVMKSGVRLHSESGEPDCVTVDAGGLGRLIYCRDVEASASIEGFRFTGGNPQGQGWAARGGAVALIDSSPLIRKCIFSDNQASNGGGGIVAVHSVSRIEDCIFARNSGVDGGGIYLDYSSPVIRGCAFYENECLFWGGAVFCENFSSPSLTGCTLARNEAYQGGGIWCVNESHLHLENSLVAFSVEGGGVYAYDDPGHVSEITVVCSDVFGNAGGNYGGTLEDQTGIGGNISADPMFCKPELDDFALDASSPCLPENNECEVQMGALGEGCRTTGVAGDATARGSELLRSAPNPFGPGTRISFRIPEPSRVTLQVFDPAGRLVRGLADARLFPAGLHVLRWDGRDDAGRLLPSSVYVSRLRAGNAVATHRMVLLR